MRNNFAPIGICTYNRVNHLRATVESLQSNSLAKQSTLYIFSDAPRPGDEDAVKTLRDYVKTIDGFKEVVPVFQKENNLLKNTSGGLKMLVEKYGEAIYMEDDNVTSPCFLEYMNHCLDNYRNERKVMAISGYCPQIRISSAYPYDVYFTPIFCPWGFGVWKDRVASVEKLQAEGVLKVKSGENTLLRYYGKNLVRRANEIPDVDAFYFMDTVVTLFSLRHNMLTVTPKYSLVKNIGFDGSGLRCNGHDKQFDIELCEGFFPKKYPSKVASNPYFDREIYLIQSYSKHPKGLKKYLYLLKREIDRVLKR